MSSGTARTSPDNGEVFMIRSRVPIALIVTVVLTSNVCRHSTADEIDIVPTRDNTLYEQTDGLVSNGMGSFFFVGNTDSFSIRRGLLYFDLTTTVPSGSTINSVTLTLYMSKTMAGPQQISLHRLLNSWGEGNSDAAGAEGSGDGADFRDASWKHRYYYVIDWDNLGGDFSPGASATTTVGGIAFYNWSSSGMVDDVQAWVDNPDANHGWLLKGNESTDMTTKRFDSRHTDDTNPVLTIDFTPAVGAGACCLDSGTCMQASSAACAAVSGTFQGVATACSPGGCPQPSGGCCLENECQTLTPFACDGGAGIYLGDDVACTPELCLPLTGACCLDNGDCFDITVGDCNIQLGLYGGAGTACSTFTCPSGGCCFGDNCFFLSETACADFNGAFSGIGVPCVPNPCVAAPCSIEDCADIDDNGIRDDGCTYWECVDDACAGTPIVYADLGGEFGDCFPDGATDGNDRFHALNCFSNLTTFGVPGYPCEANPPTAFNVDAAGLNAPCTPDGVCDGNDAFAALNAFSGDSTCSCPGPAPTPPPAGSRRDKR